MSSSNGDPRDGPKTTAPAGAISSREKACAQFANSLQVHQVLVKQSVAAHKQMMDQCDQLDTLHRKLEKVTAVATDALRCEVTKLLTPVKHELTPCGHTFSAQGIIQGMNQAIFDDLLLVRPGQPLPRPSTQFLTFTAKQVKKLRKILRTAPTYRCPTCKTPFVTPPVPRWDLRALIAEFNQIMQDPVLTEYTRDPDEVDRMMVEGDATEDGYIVGSALAIGDVEFEPYFHF